MKKVLIISYYWPPSGGGGVMRWLKMSKYLPDLGWQPIIYTPENPDSLVNDESLRSEIHPDIVEIKSPIWEPYSLYRIIAGKKKSEKFKAGYVSEASTGNWKSKLSIFIRGNFLIPDPRMFWIRPSIKYLSEYLEKNPVDLIVSTGPPHSMHLIVLGLKRRFDIPWIADFRDPWTNIDFYSKLKLTRWADRKHRRLEKKVLAKADHIVTVSPTWRDEMSNMCKRKVNLIYNGYDHSDFENIETTKDKKFTITHFGVFNKDRNPFSLWKALNQIVNENPEFKENLIIQLIGQTDDSVIDSIKKQNLNNNLKTINYLPHAEGIKKLKKSQLLLLPINNAQNVMGILPGKMYEYFALQRPIIGIGPIKADFAKIIVETKSGVCFNFSDIEGIKQTIEKYYIYFKQGEVEIKSDSYDKFSRKNQVKEFMSIIDHKL